VASAHGVTDTDRQIVSLDTKSKLRLHRNRISKRLGNKALMLELINAAGFRFESVDRWMLARSIAGLNLVLSLFF
jgi:hypothetical protein